MDRFIILSLISLVDSVWIVCCLVGYYVFSFTPKITSFGLSYFKYSYSFVILNYLPTIVLAGFAQCKIKILRVISSFCTLSTPTTATTIYIYSIVNLLNYRFKLTR